MNDFECQSNYSFVKCAVDLGVTVTDDLSPHLHICEGLCFGVLLLVVLMLLLRY